MAVPVRRSLLIVAVAIGCTVYDGALLQDAPPSAGGAGGDDGAGGGAGDVNVAGATTEGGAAGSDGVEDGGAPSGGSGGSAGTSSQGGSAGTSQGGSGGGGTSGLELIDNFEDGTASVAPFGNRGGAWYLFNDGTSGSQGPPQFYAVLLPEPDQQERPGSQRALHVEASGYDESGVAADFVFGKAQYNASAYNGVRFWAKVEGGALDQVRLRFPDVQTLQKGMQCSTAADAGTSACGDHYGKDVTLTTSWQEYTVTFDELTHAGTGNPGPGGALDQAHVYSIEFVFGSGDVDFWLDDLNFILD